MERVLFVETAEERNHGFVEHVAVEEKLEETREQVDREKRGGEPPDPAGELGLPHGVGRDELQEHGQGGERGGDGEEEKRKRKLLFDAAVG